MRRLVLLFVFLFAILFVTGFNTPSTSFASNGEIVGNHSPTLYQGGWGINTWWKKLFPPKKKKRFMPIADATATAEAEVTATAKAAPTVTKYFSTKEVRGVLYPENEDYGEGIGGLLPAYELAKKCDSPEGLSRLNSIFTKWIRLCWGWDEFGWFKLRELHSMEVPAAGQ